MTDQVNPETGEIVNTSARKVPQEIIKARIAVMKDAYGVGKTGKNTFHNYDYASDYDVLSLVQPSIAKNGLVLEMWPEEVIGPDENGNMWVRFLMQWQHESGACSDPTPWYGVAQDRDRQGRMGDKWFNKAATAAEKYFLLKQFHIPAGKDVDPDKAAQEANPPYQGRTQAQRQPAQPTAAETDPGLVTIRSDQKKVLDDLLAATDADVSKFCQYLGVDQVADITVNQFDRAKRTLEAKWQRQRAQQAEDQ